MPRLAAMSRRRTPGSCAMHSSTRAWLVRKVQLAIINMLLNSRNVLLVFWCGRSVRVRHRNSAAKGGQLPGATGGAHAHRPGYRHRRGHGARGAAYPAEAVGALASQIPGPAAADAAAVTR